MAAATGHHTLGGWLADRAVTHGQKVAIDDCGVTIGYAELERRSAELAAGLLRAGYGVGDRVVTLTGNSIDHVVVFFACAKAGLALVPLSWRLTASELTHLLRAAGPALVLAEDDLLQTARTALRLAAGTAPLTTLGSTGVETTVPTRPVAPGEPWPEQRPVADDDPLLVIFTSGSESQPKGAVLTHANCFWTNHALGRAIEVASTDVVLAVLPQFHVAGWNVQPLLALWHGATVVLERAFVPSRVLQLIAERRVTTVMAVPTQYHLLAVDPAFPEADLSSLRTVLVGGARMPDELAATWARRGVDVRRGYGLTEASPNVLIEGRPYACVDVRLVDPATGDVVLGEGTGELQVHGPTVFQGYLADPVATARAFDGEWLRTGDLARRVDERLTIVDRIKNIYISGGENVSPAEVEAVLARHPLVAEAAVVSTPDPVWGEVGLAFVQAVPGITVTPDEVLDHARQHLAGYKVPARVVVVDDLPRTGIGKIARSQLATRAGDIHAGGPAAGADRPGGPR